MLDVNEITFYFMLKLSTYQMYFFYFVVILVFLIIPTVKIKEYEWEFLSHNKPKSVGSRKLQLCESIL